MDDDFVVAHLLGHDVKVGEYDKGIGPTSFDHGPQEDAVLIADQRIVNDLRRYALPLLAAALLPDCATEPTAEDMKAFYPYWRRALQADIARHPELADRAAIAKREAMNAQFPPEFGRILPQTPLPDMLQVSAATPGADAIARRLIRQWRLYHCVQARYGGEKFFSMWAGPDGTGWPKGPAHCGEAVEDHSHAIPTPCLDLAEPIAALGGLFHDAKDKGLLRFSRPGIDAYFFDRYDGNDFATVKESEKVKAWLATPPWLTAN